MTYRVTVFHTRDFETGDVFHMNSAASVLGWEKSWAGAELGNGDSMVMTKDVPSLAEAKSALAEIRKRLEPEFKIDYKIEMVP